MVKETVLNLYIGRAGTGKTTRIHEELSALAESRPAVLPILLVPEQASFETERALLLRMGAEKAAYVRVLSFTRLAETVAREVGGLAGKRLDDAARTLLIGQALETVADHLQLYRRQIGSGAFTDTLCRLLSECRQCAVSPAALGRAGEQSGNVLLSRKVRELSLILEAYDALQKSGYIDPLENLDLLARQLPRSSIVRGAAVYADGFKGFTPQEMAVLKAMMPQAASVTVALCTPALHEENGFSLFSPVIRTAERLLRMANEAGVRCAAPRRFTENHRAAVPALRQLEAEAFSPLPVPTTETQGVTLMPCADIYAECAAVARELRRQLGETGRRARELAVVMRQPESYRGALTAALRREGIPFYWDARADITAEPLSVLLLTAVQIAAEGYRTDRLLTLMKTGLCGFSVHSAALLENYAALWNIRGEQWDRPWTMNPAGLTVRADEETDRRLWYLNLLRGRLIKPLKRLRGVLREPASGETLAKALWTYLVEVRAGLQFGLRLRQLQQIGEWESADRQSQLWDSWMSLLDTLATAAGAMRIGGRRLYELLRQMAAVTDIATLPAGLDSVQVGAVDRVRLGSPRAVFILGANEGVFPAYPPSDGLFTDRERQELIALGLPMAEPADGQAMEERFFAYTALSAPSEELHISWVCGNSAGEAQSPSALVSTVHQILPGLTETSARPDVMSIRSAGEALEVVALQYRHPTVETVTLEEALRRLPERREALRQIEEASAARPAAFRDPEKAKALFGRDMRLSPSQVDAFYRCRFSYFCRYGMKVIPPRPAALGKAEFGTLAHALMQQALPAYVAEGIGTVTRERVGADSREILTRYVETEMGGAEDKGVRFAELMERLIGTAAEFLWHVVEELRQSRFVPVDYELPIGMGGEDQLPAEVLTLPDGSRIRVRGVVDRVDVFHRDGQAYVRVVDYKTGDKKFRLSEVVEGLDLQMLIYLFTIWQNGGPRYGSVTPAGVLYLPAALPVISAERGTAPEELHRKKMRTMRMDGLVLDDPEIIRAMEADAGGVFIPAKLTTQGKIDSRTSAVASLGQLGRLKKRTEALLLSMAETLHRGDIAAVPVTGEQNPCVYCRYRSVCRHEADDPVRFLFQRSPDEVWSELEEDGG